jgi:hypothetical protein
VLETSRVTSSDWPRRIAAALVVLVAGGYAVYKEWPDVKHQVKGYSFAEVLPLTVDSVGKDARVLSVLDRAGDVSFEVLTGDGSVQQRFYGKVCTSSPDGPGSACANRGTQGQRRATGRDRDAAVIRLGDLESGVVAHLRDQSGAGDDAPIGLRGRRWVVVAPDPYIADVDGSNLHRAAAGELLLVQSVASDPGAR